MLKAFALFTTMEANSGRVQDSGSLPKPLDKLDKGQLQSQKMPNCRDS